MGRIVFRIMLAAGMGMAVSGCHFFHGIFGGRNGETPPATQAAPDWRNAVTDADRDRLRRLRGAWEKALAQARAAGHGPELAALGSLANPDAALPDPAPQPGDYRCRTIKLGAKSEGMLDYVAYPPFDCVVTTAPGGRLTLAKVSGSQRQQGMLWPDGPTRMVFLGTLQLGDESGAMTYGVDAGRDVAGVVERVGPGRWRLALPWPQWESNLDLVELTSKG